MSAESKARAYRLLVQAQNAIDDAIRELDGDSTVTVNGTPDLNRLWREVGVAAKSLRR